MPDNLDKSLNGVIARAEARAAKAKAALAHRQRMHEDVAYRAAQKMANVLDRYADRYQGGSIMRECHDLASKIRAAVAPRSEP